MSIPCCAYACTNLIRYPANALSVASSLFIVPPSNGETALPDENGPCFIQVGGVEGLAQRRMLGLTAWAALTYGMSACMSRSIEKLASDVSPAVSSSV